MYVAKEKGGGYEVYQDSFDRHNPQRLTLIGQVRPALETGEFVMFYQPKVRLVDGRVAGAEALIRWEHPTLGLVPPDEFIPLVEKTVLLRPLTQYDRSWTRTSPTRSRDCFASTTCRPHSCASSSRRGS
jgi:predicted signal transduction protein with EAL and GGDEF domain